MYCASHVYVTSSVFALFTAPPKKSPPITFFHCLTDRFNVTLVWWSWKIQILSCCHPECVLKFLCWSAIRKVLKWDVPVSTTRLNVTRAIRTNLPWEQPTIWTNQNGSHDQYHRKGGGLRAPLGARPCQTGGGPLFCMSYPSALLSQGVAGVTLPSLKILWV